MIQDITPYKFHIEYHNYLPEKNDMMFVFQDHKLMIGENERLTIINWKEWEELSAGQTSPVRLNYLFAIDDVRFFYCEVSNEFNCPAGYRMAERMQLRHMKPKHLAYAAATACQLDGWYTSNRYCGCCATQLIADEKERMLKCPNCKNTVYPRINPAVIVAITYGSKLLLTKYRGRAVKNYALVAGFNEVGESLEETVHREVMEETGLKVKNLRYYKSQPWAFSDNVLVGYFCELDGSDVITMEEEELSVARFVERDEINVEWDDISLTNDMICAFIENKQI